MTPAIIGLNPERRRPVPLEGKYLLCLFTILILTLIDGTMTILLIARGAWEANPVMRYALAVSPQFFLLFKYFLTAPGIMFLVMNGHRRIFKGLFRLETFAGLFVLLYEALIIYEVVLYQLLK